MRVTVVCPYCGNKNRFEIPSLYPRMQIAYCDIEETPGCDRQFAWTYEIEVKPKTYELKENGNE